MEGGRLSPLFLNFLDPPLILQTTFLARGQINNGFRPTRKSEMNSEFFARLKTRKRFRFHREILTKVASVSMAFKTTIVVVIRSSLYGGFQTSWC